MQVSTIILLVTIYNRKQEERKNICKKNSKVPHYIVYKLVREGP